MDQVNSTPEDAAESPMPDGEPNRQVLPYRTTDNRIDGIVITFVDIAARKQAGDALGGREAWFRGQREATEAALDGASLESSLGVLVRSAMEALGGGTRAAFYLADDGGKSLYHVVGMPPDYAEAVDGFRIGPESLACGLATHAGQPILTADVMKDPYWEPWRKMAERFDYRGYWSFPILSSAGKFVGTFAVYSQQPREATEANLELASLLTHTASIIISRHAESEARKRAELALRENGWRLRLALAAARMGIWSWDVAADVQVRDANLNRLLGLEPVETRQPLGDFLAPFVHPEDREAVATAFRASVEHGHELNLEFRVVRPDGSIRWLRDQGDGFREDGARTSVMAGACVDITDMKEAEAALRAGEERLRLVVASATDYAFIIQDPARRVTGWSPGAEAIFGYTEEEIAGRSSDILFTPEDREAGAPEAQARTALHKGRAADERWHVRKDGTRFYASGVLSPLGEDGARGFVKVARDLTERKRVEDDLQGAHDELERRVSERTAELRLANEAMKESMAVRQELLRRVVAAQEDERRRVARDLHDVLGQELTALLLGLAALTRAVPEGAPGRDRLLEVERIVNRIGREAHDLAIELRPTSLDDLGLGPALSAYVARWSDRTGTSADFQALGLEGVRMPPEVETTVYRIVQEALNNVAKHAEASQVSVIVERREDEVTAFVEDNGRGFDPDQPGPNAGRQSLGLLGMRERVGLVGGTLLVDSSEGQGTMLRARIALRRPGEEHPDA